MKDINKIKERYYIDERAGCIAIRDRKQMGDDPSPGLHDDTPGVVEYWHGIPQDKKCQMCGHVSFDGWVIPDNIVVKAKRICDELNNKLSDKLGVCHTLDQGGK